MVWKQISAPCPTGMSPRIPCRPARSGIGRPTRRGFAHSCCEHKTGSRRRLTDTAPSVTFKSAIPCSSSYSRTPRAPSPIVPAPSWLSSSLGLFPWRRRLGSLLTSSPCLKTVASTPSSTRRSSSPTHPTTRWSSHSCLAPSTCRRPTSFHQPSSSAGWSNKAMPPPCSSACSGLRCRTTPPHGRTTMCFVAGTRQRLSGMPFPLKKVEFHTCIPWVIQVDFKLPGAVYAFGFSVWARPSSGSVCYLSVWSVV